MRQPVILFNARILKNKTPAGGSRLVYTTIGQTIGDAFNKDTGVFTAPVNGTYLFSSQIVHKVASGEQSKLLSTVKGFTPLQIITVQLPRLPLQVQLSRD